MSHSAMYAKAFVDAVEKTPAEEQPQVISRFVEKIREDHVESLASEILSSVKREMNDRATRRATVVEVSHKNSVAPEIFVRFDSPKVRENDKLIGGFLVTRQGEIIDASVSGGLKQVRSILVKE